MREIELKAVVDNLDVRRHAVEAAGARLVFEGRLEDRRYDTNDRALAAKDCVLRLRIYRTGERVSAQLDWKGATEESDGFKVRDEINTGVSDPKVLATILAELGYVVTREIDREIIQYELNGTDIRFERYPRLDVLVEVEGTPEGIEGAIAATGLPREAFTTKRLADFISDYETRTGVRAAVSDRELAGEYRYGVKDA